MDLGRFELCLPVKDLARSIAFYETLGFERVGGVPEKGWAILAHGPQGRRCRIGLYQGMIPYDVLNFRGGDVFAIAKDLEARGLRLKTGPMIEQDGSAGATLLDPDGNEIYLNTAPGETPEA